MDAETETEIALLRADMEQIDMELDEALADRSSEELSSLAVLFAVFPDRILANDPNFVKMAVSHGVASIIRRRAERMLEDHAAENPEPLED